jgi:YggT family protein
LDGQDLSHPARSCGHEKGRVNVQAFNRSEGIMLELLSFISYLLTLYIYVLIAMAVMSWLIAFSVVNSRSPIVHAIGDFLYRITDPLLRPIRNLLPNLGGIDISPVILILIIIFIQSVIIPNIAKLFI